jgi:hypothetical protein
LRDARLCWICGERPVDSAEHKVKASDIRSVAPSLSQRTPAFVQINSEPTNQPICSAKAHALKFPRSVCGHCNSAGTQLYDEAWRRLSSYLHANWREITDRGSFDLSKVFGAEAASQAIRVQLYFVKLLGCKLLADGILVDLGSFAKALMAGTSHPEVTLLVASSLVPSGQLLSYESDVSVLRNGDEVLSAVWMNLVHPVGIKICYLKAGAPVREPPGFPWHPTRQKKIVKLSPYKGDTEPLVARRDLRI